METLSYTTSEKKRILETERKVYLIINAVLERQKDYLSNSYLNENLREEKEHVKHKPESVKQGLTIRQGARHFYIKWILDSLVNGFRYDIKDVLTCRISSIKGEAIAKTYEKELREALKAIDLKEVLSFDYCILQDTELRRGY